MRLHRLELTAFGPFADHQQVDFDALGAAGLFLFHGPTGAGKTSILDAVCFGLYGQVPGARQQARSLRSDHAAAGVRPEVRLDVTLRGRRLLISRSPAWERPKRRGSGTTTEAARVLVQERDGSALTTLSTRLDESGQLIGRLLGLTIGQFCQVALLPQGQFAEFLRADADRRRDLLESLFDTGRFAAVEAWLVAQRQAAARALDDAERRVTQVLARVAEAAALEVPDDLDATEAGAWLDRVHDEACTALAAATTAAAAADRDRETAVAALGSATRTHELRRRRDDLLRRQTALRDARAVRDAAVVELEAARRVAPVLPLLTEVGRLQTDLEQARVVVAASHRKVTDAWPATGTDGAPPAIDGMGRSSAAARAEVGSLHRLAEQEAEADRLLHDADQLERSIVALDMQAAQVVGWLDEADQRRDGLVAARDTARDARAAVPAVTAEHRRAADRARAAQARDRAAADAVAAGDELRRRTDLAQRARADWLSLRQDRLDGIAAELAAGLRPDAACPVCGSDNHPSPAAPAASQVTREREELADRAATAAESARSTAMSQLGVLEVLVAELRAAAGGDTAVADLQAEADAAAARLDETETAAAMASAAEKALAEFDEERESRVREQVRLAQQRKEAEDRILDQRDRLRRLRSVLDEARGDDPSIAARAARLDRLADDCERLAREVCDLERLGGEVDDALARAEDAARERCAGSLDQVAAAARSDEEVTRLDDLRRQHESEVSTVEAQLAEPELGEPLLGGAPEDLSALAEAAATAERGHDDATGMLTSARARAVALERLRAALASVLADRAPVAEHFRVVDGLSRLAEGKSADNRLRMSLSGYVLAARLEQVASAASDRLMLMSSGRYSLLHTAESGAGRGRGGLHLRVLDSWTGVERDPATLSGGESFSASLALALGLADVVTAEAGGSLLETLFVDEGFGSLDEDTLEEVMGVLDGLRDGGRVVGIVSHVADLRARVPVQLTVDKGRGGSVIRQ